MCEVCEEEGLPGGGRAGGGVGGGGGHGAEEVSEAGAGCGSYGGWIEVVFAWGEERWYFLGKNFGDRVVGESGGAVTKTVSNDDDD